MMMIGEGIKHDITLLFQPWNLWDVCMYVCMYIAATLKRIDKNKQNCSNLFNFLGHPIIHMIHIYIIHMYIDRVN